MTLERREQRFDDADPEPAEDGPRTDPVGSETTTVWACVECGRSHPRNNPPCNRCGGMEFEQREQGYDDLAPSSGGWLDAVETPVALGFVGAFLLLALLVATSLGIVTLPGQGVPGEAESAAGLTLADVEDAYVAELNARRTADGLDSVAADGTLDERATWYNQRLVRALYGDADRPTRSDVRDRYEPLDACDGATRYQSFAVGGEELPGGSLEAVDSETRLAASLVERGAAQFGSSYADAEDRLVGVDVHVGPDGRVVVTQVTC